MLSISDGEALSRVLVSPLDDRIKRLLAERRDQPIANVARAAGHKDVTPTSFNHQPPTTPVKQLR